MMVVVIYTHVWSNMLASNHEFVEQSAWAHLAKFRLGSFFM